MPKETEPKNGLSREAFLKLHHEYKPLANDQDQISRQALRGMQYLNSKTSADDLFQRLDQQIDQKSKPTNRLLQLWQSPQLRIAVTVLLLFIPGYYLFESSLDTPDHAASYYQHLPTAIPGSGPNKGGQQATYYDKKEIFKAYNKQDYQQAIPKLKSYLEKYPDDLEVRFYYGMALLGNQEAAAAKRAFEQVLSNPPSPAYRENAQWHVALCLLKMNKEEQSKKLLQEIQQSGGDYASKAKKLLGEMGK